MGVFHSRGWPFGYCSSPGSDASMCGMLQRTIPYYPKRPELMHFLFQTKCLGTYLANSTCSATDFACICADVTLMNGVQDCVLGSCTIKQSLSKWADPDNTPILRALTSLKRPKTKLRLFAATQFETGQRSLPSLQEYQEALLLLRFSSDSGISITICRLVTWLRSHHW